MTNCWRAGLIRAIAPAASPPLHRLCAWPMFLERYFAVYLRHSVLPFGGNVSQTLIYILRRVGECVAFFHRLTPSGQNALRTE
ncbi:hypothetical protein VTN00DRAFT_8053 [Thermoascus crustaceus]|uniref:uncharacterized protein n=1 Tax=Thermoascus crustaceus TaxID=5088 RepID=UPI0037426EDC